MSTPALLVVLHTLGANGTAQEAWEEIAEATEALAKKLAALAPITQKASKVTLARLMESNLPDCTELMRETYNSVDFKEGVNAFLEGRPPRWLGK